MPTALPPRLQEISLPLRPRMRVLEIGCGPGASARVVARRIGGGHVLAIDRSSRAIEQAKRNCAAEIESGLPEFRQAAIEDFELRDGEPPFDLAFAVRVGALDGRHRKRGGEHWCGSPPPWLPVGASSSTATPVAPRRPPRRSDPRAPAPAAPVIERAAPAPGAQHRRRRRRVAPLVGTSAEQGLRRLEVRHQRHREQHPPHTSAATQSPWRGTKPSSCMTTMAS